MGHVIKDFKKFGRFVRQRRIALGLNQEAFGKRCGVVKNMISRMELGTTGPDIITFKKIAKVLGLPEEKLLAWAGKDEVMDGLQELNEKMGLIFKEIKGLKEEKSRGSGVSDNVNGETESDAALIMRIGNLQNRIETIENGIETVEKRREEGSDIVKEAVEDQLGDPDEVVNALLDEYEEAGPDVGFFDSILGSQKIRTAKGKMYVACCNACDSLGVDPFEKVGGFFDDAERGKALSDVLYDFSIEQVDREEAQEKLSEFLQSEESESEESESEESE